MSCQSQAEDLACNDQWPAWAPDGEHVVFVSTRSGDHEIYTLNLSSGLLIQLTDAPGRDAHPSFSPDGGHLAFQSPRNGDGTHLYIMRADGSDLRQVTAQGGFSGMPVWSPDGERLAYQWRPNEPGAKWQLMVVNIADGRTSEITPAFANDQVVNWSPDGTRLLFHSDRTGRNQVYVLENGVTTAVATTQYTDQSATWSPDGKHVAFVSTRDGATGIYKMNVDGTGQIRLGTIEIEHGLPFYSPDGTSLLVTPTGSNGVELWSLDVESGIAAQLPSACSAIPLDGMRFQGHLPQ